MMKNRQLLSAIFSLVSYASVASAAQFYNCKVEVPEFKTDYKALETIMQAHADDFRFSSQCLELLLKRNYMQASEYLLNEYYPNTNIDTEIIVRTVANDVQR